MAADLLFGTRVLAEFQFASPLNRDHIAALEWTGLRIRGAHDPHRQMLGTGFVGAGVGLVFLALTRHGGGYRLVAETHSPHAHDGAAVARWVSRVRAVAPMIATRWAESSQT